MKKQSETSKTKYARVYKDSMPTQARVLKVIDAIPERCWWLRQYLRGTLYTRKGRSYARDTD